MAPQKNQVVLKIEPLVFPDGFDVESISEWKREMTSKFGPEHWA